MTDWNQLVENFCYKPGWTFDFRFSRMRDSYWVVIRAEMLDSRGSGAMVPVAGAYVVNPEDFDLTEEQALLKLRRMINDMEQHEIDEWFVHKGKRVYDPHRDEG